MYEVAVSIEPAKVWVAVMQVASPAIQLEQ
jgi:hypothetical protein